MSMYDNNDKDIVYYEIEQFLESHSVAELLDIVAEHIKNRLYETAFNEPDTVTRNAIADMAGRIDFWVNELKDGETNYS